MHGAPTLNTLYWTEDRSDAFCGKMAKVAGAKAGDVLCFGHGCFGMRTGQRRGGSSGRP